MHNNGSGTAAPIRSGALLPAGHLAVAWSVVAALASLAWLITIQQARGMGMEPGTMGLALPLFLLLWVLMMAAMMLPSMAPVAITWARAIARQSTGAARTGRMAQFTGGYLVAWATFGLLVYLALGLTGGLVNDHAEGARWIAAIAFLLAGVYQLGPLKSVCLRHCRNPMAHLMRYAQFRSFARDLRVGADHGLYCVGCCSALMVVLIPLGVMNIAAMAALAVVIFLEKLWRHGPILARAVGFAFLALAILAPFQDWLLPGLQQSNDEPM